MRRLHLLPVKLWTRVIEEAISSIPETYYGTYPAEWIAQHINELNKEEWKACLSQYNERDWCYELYHQLRISLDCHDCLKLPHEEEEEEEGEEHIRLSGESNKSASHFAIKDGCRWSQNINCRIPDILLHDPRNTKYQIFCIEVKRHGVSGVPRERLVDDLKALVEYTCGLGFSCGFFIGLGIPDHTLRWALKALESNDDFQQVKDRIYACLVSDNQYNPDHGPRHSGFVAVDSMMRSESDPGVC
jgi:hypothetical protein